MTAIAYRPMEASDRNFVVDSWVSSYLAAKSRGCIQIEDWYPIMIPTVEKILGKPDVRTMVAVMPGTDRIANLLGFITADIDDNPALVYYVYVKEHYRRAKRLPGWTGPGIGRGLFEALGIEPARPFNYVCSTAMCRIMERKIPMSRHQPDLGTYPKSERRNRR